MPYIKDNRRVVLNPMIEDLSCLLENDGEVNYVITKLIDSHYGVGSYAQLSAGMGVLSCVAYEFYRRRCVPYKNKKAIENGEVFE